MSSGREALLRITATNVLEPKRDVCPQQREAQFILGKMQATNPQQDIF